MTLTCRSCRWWKLRQTHPMVGTCWHPTTNGQLMPDWHSCVHQEPAYVLIDSRPRVEAGQ
jgi:hypothetical protein